MSKDDESPHLNLVQRKKIFDFFRVEERSGYCDETACKKKNGRIVVQVTGVSRLGYCFGTPYCELCGEEYRCSTSPLQIGIEEFENRLISSYTT